MSDSERPDGEDVPASEADTVDDRSPFAVPSSGASEEDAGPDGIETVDGVPLFARDTHQGVPLFARETHSGLPLMERETRDDLSSEVAAAVRQVQAEHGARASLEPGSSPYQRHVFVCTHGKTCPLAGGVDLQTKLKLAARDRLGPLAVRVNKAGCLSQCGHGPMVVVYPENVWYAGVSEADVDELVTQHLENGRPVERLLYEGHVAGKNVVEDDGS